MTTYLAIISAVLLTSIISGIIGMAGGIILMAILVSLLSVSGAMIVHGFVQATSNGSRSWFLREHIQWQILPPYLIGAGIALSAFVSLTLVPNEALILICIGIFPWLARITPMLKGLNVNKIPTAISCGLVVTSAQLFAGASGPLLDVFYLNTRLTRHEIIATKALTQTIGHLLKLFYYGFIITVTEHLPIVFIACAMATAVIGARIGTRLVDRFSDEQFRDISGYVILALASVCLVTGMMRY